MSSAHVRQARSRCLRRCPGVTVTTLGRSPLRAREGHGQHLQIHSFVSDRDDRYVGHLGLDTALRAVEPPGDDRPRGRPNGFKNVRDDWPPPFLSWAFSVSAFRVAQGHPAHIPRPAIVPARLAASRARICAQIGFLSCGVPCRATWTRHAGANWPPSAFSQAGHIPSCRAMCECPALLPVGAASRCPLTAASSWRDYPGRYGR